MNSSCLVTVLAYLAVLFHVAMAGIFDIVKGDIQRGLATYYTPGPGSCGFSNVETEEVVAVNAAQMENGANPNNNPHCNQYVVIKGTHGQTKARIVDTCPMCDEGSLDLSPQVFHEVCGEFAQGKCSIRWKFAS